MEFLTSLIPKLLPNSGHSYDMTYDWDELLPEHQKVSSTSAMGTQLFALASQLGDGYLQAQEVVNKTSGFERKYIRAAADGIIDMFPELHKSAGAIAAVAMAPRGGLDNFNPLGLSEETLDMLGLNSLFSDKDDPGFVRGTVRGMISALIDDYVAYKQYLSPQQLTKLDKVRISLIAISAKSLGQTMGVNDEVFNWSTGAVTAAAGVMVYYMLT